MAMKICLLIDTGIVKVVVDVTHGIALDRDGGGGGGMSLWIFGEWLKRKRRRSAYTMLLPYYCHYF